MTHILPPRFKFSLLFLFIAILVSSAFFVGKTYAADAIPQPIVPCTDAGSEGWEDPEFNSGRPYQASPCRDSNYAVMCGNDIQVVVDHVDVTWDPARGCDSESCPYYKDPELQTKRVVIDLSNVKLPILGNTQNVTNSVNATDEFDDAQKLNEYASWYLNGANQKAEYGEDTQDKIINFSGPQKKLLPSAIQEFNRFGTLHNAGVKPEYTIPLEEEDPDIYVDTDPGQPGVQVDQSLNHNQIAVCTTHNIFGINNPWLGEEKPTPCYDGGGNQANGSVYRLLDWWEGKLSGFNDAFNLIFGWTGATAWNSRVPPFPWQFETNLLYQKAYSEWRGKQCNVVFGSLVCVDVPGLTSNSWADFYQYIPLSNTTDKRGKEDYNNVHVSAPRAELVRHQEDPSIEGTFIESRPRLYYPHTLSVLESADYLNKTYIPYGGSKGSKPGGSSSIRADVEDNTSTCQLLNVRTNTGDDLTFDNTAEKHQIDFTVYYKIESVECTNKGTKQITNPLYDPILNPTVPQYTYEPIYDCSSDIYASLNLTTLAPYLNDIWQTTTAGEQSTFRRIFPKVEEGAPVSCIADIPGVSPATYILNESGSSDSVSDLVVKNPPTSTSISPEIYFPHLGSVYEYFLKGIQTALRPQGFSGPIANGINCTPLNTASGACKQWLFEDSNYNKVIAAANATTCNGKTLNPFWAIGIALNENGGLMSDALDGSSNTHFGCNIPQVQTIEEKISCMTNTLRNDCLAGKTDEQTLSEYGYTSGYVLWPITVLNPGGSYPPPLFGSGFNTSQLIANLLSTDWKAAYANVAPTFCPNSPTLE